MVTNSKAIFFTILVCIITNISNSFIQLQGLSDTYICSERTLYKNYLIGLRKTKKLLANNTNNLVSILNFTSENTILNNTQIGAKNLIMGNVIIDVTNVKEIHIKTNKEAIIIELDKNKHDNLPALITNVNNLDSIISTLSLLSKILNLN
jgi:hypothetical protein